MDSTGTTPVKRYLKCFLCFSSPKILFSLKGRKFNDSSIPDEVIDGIVGPKTVEKLKEAEASICRSCYLKLFNFASFKETLKAGVAATLEGDCTSCPVVTQKRMAKSHNVFVEASTPCTISSNDCMTNQAKRTRKSLFPSLTEASDRVMQLIEEPLQQLFCILHLKFKYENVLDGELHSTITRADQVLKKLEVLRNSAGEHSSFIEKEVVDPVVSLQSCNVLTRMRPLMKLQACQDFPFDLLEEIIERAPLLMKILVKLIGKVSPTSIGPLTAVIGIILFQRNHMASAFQRLISLVCLRGQLEDSALTRLNHFGLCLAPTSKLNLQDEASKTSKLQIIEHIRRTPLIKITGDNLDVMVKSAHLSMNNPNRSLHLFASNMVFPRIAHLQCTTISNEKPIIPAHVPEASFILQDGAEKERMMLCYKILVSRILKGNPDEGFRWMGSYEPKYSFEFQSRMKEKSTVIQLPIMLKNEAKHEDCLGILDEFEETLTNLFIESYGNDNKLKENPVILGGDQLTRCRMQEAKALRALSGDPKKRFEDIGGIFIEFWHLKQDVLEKAFKALFSTKSCRDPASLAFLKCKLLRSDITGKVKGKFQSHFEFFSLVGEAMIIELAREFFAIDTNGSPTENIEDLQNLSKEEKRNAIGNALDSFLCHYHFLQFNLDHQETNDKVFSYCLNLCHWYLLIMALDETAKTGNIDQVIPNLKACIPFLYISSRQSKYLYECMDFIYKVQYTLSPFMKIRVLESCFVNTKGGERGNVEADLVQEHSVRAQKTLIRQLGANKTEKAILRSASAGVVVDSVCRQIDTALHIKPKSSRHTKTVSAEDKEKILQILRNTKPFTIQPSRDMKGFLSLGKTPVTKLDKRQFNFDIEILKHRVVQGTTIFNQEENQIESDGEEDVLPPL